MAKKNVKAKRGATMTAVELSVALDVARKEAGCAWDTVAWCRKRIAVLEAQIERKNHAIRDLVNEIDYHRSDIGADTRVHRAMTGRVPEPQE